jgi:uridine phosphorylase
MGELRQPRGQGLCWLGAFGVGAPATAVAVEQLAARGVQRIVAVGLAGGLTTNLPAGAVVLAHKALRDEGTSYHYLPAERYAHADIDLTEVLSVALADFAIPNGIGATWTTDAPLRETAEEVAAYTAEGVLTVEMEAAALFAVGQALGVQTAAVLIVSDTLHSGRWQASPPNLSLLRRVWAIVVTALSLAE